MDMFKSLLAKSVTAYNYVILCVLKEASGIISFSNESRDQGLQ